MSLHRAFLLLTILCPLTACTASTVEPVSEEPVKKAMAVSMSDEWVRQQLLDTNLSFEYPVPLNMNHVASGGAAHTQFTALSHEDHTMYALSVPYERAPHEQHLPFFRAVTREELMTTGSCDSLDKSATTLTIDLEQPHICSVYQGDDGPVAYAIGFLAGSDVPQFNAMMLFLGPDQALLIEQVFPLKDLHPEAQRSIDDYFKKHPTMTQLWWDVPSVQQLMRKLEPQYIKAVKKPSPAVKTAMAFMERIAMSAEWD